MNMESSTDDAPAGPSFTTTQRVLYWGSAVGFFFLMLATTPDIGVVTNPAESLGALFGTVVIWLVAAPAAKRRWGHRNTGPDATA